MIGDDSANHARIAKGLMRAVAWIDALCLIACVVFFAFMAFYHVVMSILFCDDPNASPALCVLSGIEIAGFRFATKLWVWVTALVILNLIALCTCKLIVGQKRKDV